MFLRYCMPNFNPQETCCWMLKADWSVTVMPGTTLWMLTPYSTWRCLSLKSFKYDCASFYMQNSQASWREVITGLRLWHVMRRFLRDEDVFVMFYWNKTSTTSILYYSPHIEKASHLYSRSICYFLERGKRRGDGWA